MLLPRAIRPSRNLSLWLVALPLLLVPPAAAQSHGLTGTVTSRDGAGPVRGAVVQVDGRNLRATTGPTGRFFLPGLPPGVYEMTVRAVGYVPQRTEFAVDPEGQAVVNVVLETRAVRLRDIQVLRDRTEMGRYLEQTAGSATVIDRSGFEDQNALHGDVHQLMRRVPGTNVQEEDGYGLRPNIGLRGTGSERSSKITLMEDGVLIAPAPYAAPSAYYFPHLGRMAGVEVRKGSSQLKYGPRTVGGAVNLVSARVPDDLALELDVVGGSNSTAKLSGLAGDSYQNVGWMVQGHHVNTTGFKSIDRPTGTVNRGPFDSGYDITNVVGKFRINTSPPTRVYQELDLKLGYYDETSNETYLGVTDADFARNPVRRYAASQRDQMRAEHWQVQARHFLRLSDRVDVTTTVYNNDFQRNWYKLQSVMGASLSEVLNDPAGFSEEYDILVGGDSPDDALRIRANNRSYYSRGVQSVLGVRFGGLDVVNQVEIGVRYHGDQEDRFQWEDGFRMAAGSLVETSRGTPGSQSNRVNTANALSAYVQDEIAFGRWIVTPGVRYEHIRLRRSDYPTDPPLRAVPTRVRDNAVDAVIPGLGVAFEVGPGFRLFGGLHRGFNPPGPGSDEAVRPETSANYEMGARLHRPGVALEVAAFYTDYANILGTSTLATGDQGTGDQFNGGAATITGAELSIGLDPLWGRQGESLPLDLSFTYTSAEFDTSFDSAYEPWGNVQAGDELPYVPAVAFHGSIGFVRSSWEVQGVATYTSAMRTFAGQGGFPVGGGTDPALVFGASGEYRVSRWRTTLFAAVRNIFDTSYVVARRPAGVRPGLPRTLMGGARLTL